MSIVLVVVILAGSNARSVHCQGKLRVYHGEADSRAEFPFAVMLQYLYMKIPLPRFCTGSLIADNWVLTAAHCVHKIPIEMVIIRYGDFTKPANETKLYSKVIKIHEHPELSLLERINDIAIISVEKVPNKKHAKLLALDHKTYVGLHVKYAGFGYTQKSIDVNNSAENRKLQYIPLQVGEGVVVPCEKYFITAHVAVYKYSKLCVAPKSSKKEQQTRPGDSGGPLVYDGRVIGVSSTILNALPISVYHPVSPYLEWIQNTMHSNKK